MGHSLEKTHKQFEAANRLCETLGIAALQFIAQSCGQAKTKGPN